MNRDLSIENEEMHSDLIQLERELTEKNKKIKLLTLNISCRDFKLHEKK